MWKIYWLRWTLKIIGSCIAIMIIWIILLKWIPVFFTPTMFFRSIENMWQGKSGTIYYEWVSYDQINDAVKVAVIASEDQRFPTHTGIDFEAIKVAVKENKQNKQKRGASTISQQVAKNVFLWQGGGYFRKALEVPLTYLIEIIWGKKRILEVYLNIAEMAPQTFGIQATSKKIFKKKAQFVTPFEAGTIAAVLPNPNHWWNTNFTGIINYRRQHTLYQMQMLGGANYIKNLK
ncbi:MAG: monofunctional biosynthetic peptidoglycan transglycosylase [Cytophagia bacterium]|nr:MAG: monofunctional biosynthetic peptidoglycan transglycosylase [Cytophagia bacterium]TAH30860.1 MAG: monofunctional biosynthetic peptidoglycan transglycosylase [Cytophagales bacterium]